MEDRCNELLITSKFENVVEEIRLRTDLTWEEEKNLVRGFLEFLPDSVKRRAELVVNVFRDDAFWHLIHDHVFKMAEVKTETFVAFSYCHCHEKLEPYKEECLKNCLSIFVCADLSIRADEFLSVLPFLEDDLSNLKRSFVNV